MKRHTFDGRLLTIAPHNPTRWERERGARRIVWIFLLILAACAVRAIV